ncbi:MAG: hypothetical protein QXE19_06550 [Candidatus Bathyarchaeia archaeon]
MNKIIKTVENKSIPTSNTAYAIANSTMVLAGGLTKNTACFSSNH